MTSPNTRRHLPVRPNDEAVRRENAIRLAFVNASSALGCRPQAVRSTIDKAASTEARRPWKSFAEPLRAIAIDASRRDQGTQRRTEDLLIDAVISLLHYVLEPLDAGDVADVSYLAIAKELPEAIDAVTVARLVPTAENIATADREAGEAACALQLHRGGLRRAATFVRPRGATPLGIA